MKNRPPLSFSRNLVIIGFLLTSFQSVVWSQDQEVTDNPTVAYRLDPSQGGEADCESDLFDVQGLPAISEDGSLVAVASSTSPQGNNFVFQARRVEDDSLTFDLTVCEIRNHDPFERIEGRLNAVNEFLGQHSWEPMSQASVNPVDDLWGGDITRYTMDGDVLDLLFDDHALSVASRAFGLVFHGSVPPNPDRVSSDGCVPSTVLRDVYVDFERGVVLIFIGYHSLISEICDARSVFRTFRLSHVSNETDCAYAGGACSSECQSNEVAAYLDGCGGLICCITNNLPVDCADIGGDCREDCPKERDNETMYRDESAYCLDEDIHCCVMRE